MKEILPGIHHWSTFHERIQDRVHSYCVQSGEGAVLVDPRVPDEGLEWFSDRPPQHAILTNRHHYRHCARFAEAFGTRVWCHREGLHEFGDDHEVGGFDHGDELPGGLLALEIGVLCPEETALFDGRHGGVLWLGDALIREAGRLGFVPDPYIGEDPEGVKRGLLDAFRRLLDEREFAHLLFAHGEPLLDDGAEALQRFVEEDAG